jgi:hypothetical protein
MIRSQEMGDSTGIAVAVACALHCLAAPILGAALPMAGVLVSDRAELAFLGSSLLISGTTVVATCRRQGSPAVWGAFLVGAALLVAGGSGTEWSELLEASLVVGGAGLIVAAHVMNIRQCRCRDDRPSCVATD